MAFTLSGGIGGAGTGASVGGMIGGPVGAGIGAAAGGLLGLFSGKSLSKEEKAILAQLTSLGNQQATLGADLIKQSSSAGKRYDAAAKGVRSGGLGQAANYWSSLLGGDRAKMQSATSGARGAVADTYRGGRRGLERSSLKGAQKGKAEAELNRQETGQLAGLVQGVQPMAAQELGALEAQVQQLMQGYFGLGEQAKSSGAYAGASLMGGAGNAYGQVLDSHRGIRGEQSANDAANGGAFGKLLGYGQDALAGFQWSKGAPGMNNKMGAGSKPAGNWTSPKTPLTYGGGAPSGGSMNYFNATTKPRNPWGGVSFGG